MIPQHPSPSAGPGSSGRSPSTREPWRVDIVGWEGVELLDVAGPAEVFGTALQEGAPAFDVRMVGMGSDRIRTQTGVALMAEGRLGDRRAEIVVVPGGASEVARADEALLEALRAAAARAEIVYSVCTGALVLARAGLLEDVHQATTWHGAFLELAREAPHLEVVTDRRWVDSGQVVTAAGVSAGIDGALHLVGRLLGPRARADVIRHMEYAEPRPSDLRSGGGGARAGRPDAGRPDAGEPRAGEPRAGGWDA